MLRIDRLSFLLIFCFLYFDCSSGLFKLKDGSFISPGHNIEIKWGYLQKLNIKSNLVKKNLTDIIFINTISDSGTVKISLINNISLPQDSIINNSYLGNIVDSIFDDRERHLILSELLFEDNKIIGRNEVKYKIRDARFDYFYDKTILINDKLVVIEYQSSEKYYCNLLKFEVEANRIFRNCKVLPYYRSNNFRSND